MTPPTVRRTRAIETGGAIEAGSSAASNRAAIGWGIVVGVIQAATPLVFWWLDSATVYALGLAVIAAIYVGFAVSDGRGRVIAVETGVAFIFVRVGTAAVTGTRGCWSPASSATG